jgi:hypothetical protein
MAQALSSVMKSYTREIEVQMQRYYQSLSKKDRRR